MKILSFLLLVVVVVTVLLHSSVAQQCDQSSDFARFDCYPESDASETKCLSRGCCWRLPLEPNHRVRKSKNLTALRDVNVPYCYYPKDFPSYTVVSKTDTDFGQRILLNKSQLGYMPNDLSLLTVDLIYETEQRLRMKIYDSNRQRYEVPLPVPKVEKKVEQTDYKVQVNNQPFSLQVTRASNGMVLFDSSVAPLIFADQFIKLSTRLSSPFVYGLGEHRQSLLLNVTDTWKKLTFWSRDFPPVQNTNLYGVHPFHLNLELSENQNTNVHGQFFLNSNGMDIDLQPLPALTYTTIGGIIDLYIFTGPTVHEVIEQYWQVIGNPMMPPYWSLGFHLCRYGYGNIENLIQVIQRMHDADFPYDAQWTDIDAMSSYLDFTYDKTNFHELPDLVRALQANGIHYVNIIDPGISSVQPSGTYPPFDEGVKRGIFIKKFNSSELILGKVWPGTTAFPDFTNPEAIEWWIDAAAGFHDSVPFDGMWIDMNEPSNFVDGSLDGCTMNNLDNPPFTPNVLGGKLSSKSLCPSAQQYLSSHYNLHSMFGYFEAKASNAAMKKIREGRRPFILSRSSFAGSGQFTAHWTGDNRATFDDMYYSIPAILSFNMFGLTHVGADICGFGLDTTPELCTRWMQLGAFYPFMRNHNDLGQKDQDPAAFPWENQQIMKQALMMRYSLMPFWYTLHHQAAMASKTVVQPLFYEYLNDKNTYNIDKQFLVGRALLVSPNLVSGTDTVTAYIPSDTWYEFPSGIRVNNVGTFAELYAPLTTLNLHLRGGFIIPMQIPGPNLMIGRGNPFNLVVAPSQYNNASGNLFWDDGDAVDSIDKKNYNYLEFLLTNDNTLTINALVRNYKDEAMRLEIVKILGVKNSVESVTVNGKDFSKFLYNAPDQILMIYGLDMDMAAEDSQMIQWKESSTDELAGAPVHFRF